MCLTLARYPGAYCTNNIKLFYLTGAAIDFFTTAEPLLGYELRIHTQALERERLLRAVL